MFAKTPEPPYYSVIFVFRTTGVDMDEYAETSARLMEKARKIDGFYGEDAVKTEGGNCITVSYWRDEEAIRQWRDDAEHTATRKIGRENGTRGSSCISPESSAPIAFGRTKTSIISACNSRSPSNKDFLSPPARYSRVRLAAHRTKSVSSRSNR